MKRIGLLVMSLTVLFLAGSCTPKKELFVYTTLEEDIAKKLFNTYQTETGVTVNFVRLSTGEAAARIEAEKNNPQASLWVGGVGLGHIQIKQKGLSEPYNPQGSEKLPKEFVDADHYWTGLYLGLLCFVANTNELEKYKLKAPTSWQDLLNPAYKGHIQISNPQSSGTAYTIITSLIKLYGEKEAMAYMKKLHHNISQYTRSGSAPSKNAVLGETALAVGYSHDSVRLIYESKAPLAISYPTEGSGYEIASVSLLKGAKQPELAKQLYDWLYTKQASQILADLYIVPLMHDGVTLKQHSVAPDAIKLIHTDIEWDGKNRDRLVEMWNDQVNNS